MSYMIINITDGIYTKQGAVQTFFLYGLSAQNFCQAGPSQFQFQYGLASKKQWIVRGHPLASCRYPSESVLVLSNGESQLKSTSGNLSCRKCMQHIEISQSLQPYCMDFQV